MARSANVKQKKEPVALSDELKRRLREAGALLLLPLALYLLVCLFSYDAQDPSWSHVGAAAHVHNLGGTVGAADTQVAAHFSADGGGGRREGSRSPARER